MAPQSREAQWNTGLPATFFRNDQANHQLFLNSMACCFASKGSWCMKSCLTGFCKYLLLHSFSLRSSSWYIMVTMLGTLKQMITFNTPANNTYGFEDLGLIILFRLLLTSKTPCFLVGYKVSESCLGGQAADMNGWRGPKEMQKGLDGQEPSWGTFLTIGNSCVYLFSSTVHPRTAGQLLSPFCHLSKSWGPWHQKILTSPQKQCDTHHRHCHSCYQWKVSIWALMTPGSVRVRKFHPSTKHNWHTGRTWWFTFQQ